MQPIPLITLALSIAASACFSAPGYSAPGGATLPVGTRLDPEHQQGRWACTGFDLVLANDTLYELNRDYAMKGTRAEGATKYQYALGGYVFAFLVPDDPTQPLLISANGTAMTSAFSATTTTPTQSSSYSSASSESGAAQSPCAPQPPVTVW